MKTCYLIGIIAIILLLCLAGCKNAGEVVEDETVEEEVSGAATVEEEGEVDVKDLIKQLTEEAGLETEEEEEEEVVSTGKTIVIENFRGNPEDLTIKAGTTVTWENGMTFMNVIIILPQKNDSNKYETKWINDLVELWVNESYSYTFEEAGNFKWGSKTKFDKTYGFITVTE
jgi:plastocyanin